MIYRCIIQGDTVTAYHEDGTRAAAFDTETFLLQVISPREFRAFERNPAKTRFFIRKIDKNNFKKNLKKFV